MNRSSKRARRDVMHATTRRTVEGADVPESRTALAALVVIAVATLLVYSNTFDASLHFDDIREIVENQSVRDLRHFWPPSGSRWLGMLSFAVNYRLGGARLVGYHVVNLVIHLCNSLLVFWLATLSLRTPALRGAEAGPFVRRYLPLTAALLFAVHPVQTQAVTYVVQRFTSLATLFYLLSLVLYATARLSLEEDPSPTARVAWTYGLSVLTAAAAMKTKEISFTLPLVAAGYELLLFRNARRLALLMLLPLGATALLIPLAYTSGAKGFGDALVTATGAEHISRWTYLLTQSRVVVTYLRLLLCPVRQNLDYDFPLSHSLAEPNVLMALVVLLSIAASVAVLLRQARNANRATGVLVFLGVAWFFVTLSVESSIFPIRDVIVEHRVYLPSAGAAVALGAVLLWLLERLRSSISPKLQVGAALLITAGPLAAAAYARNFVWKDELSLWSDVVAKSPQKARPHNNLGEALFDRGQFDGAEREYREALRLDPSIIEAHFNLGLIHEAEGRFDEAVREYGEAIKLAPALARPHNHLGFALETKGLLEEAVREYLVALTADPTDPETLDNLGNVYVKQGRPDDAIAAFEQAIAELEQAHRDYVRVGPILLSPSNQLAAVRTNLGIAFEAKGRVDDATREYREAIRLDPGRAEAHNALGDLLRRRGRAVEAVEQCRLALELNPRPEFALSVAFALDAVGRGAEAIPYFQRFLNEARNQNPDLAREAETRIARQRSLSRSPP